MKLEKELGSYGKWVIHEYVSFRTNTTSAPDQIRDGKTGLVLSVTRVSAGLFTIALRTDRPSPVRHMVEHVNLAFPANTAPTQTAIAGYVDGSWNQAAGTFQVLVTSAVASSAAVDPDAHARISITLTGSISSVGTDAA